MSTLSGVAQEKKNNNLEQRREKMGEPLEQKSGFCNAALEERKGNNSDKLWSFPSHVC